MRTTIQHLRAVLSIVLLVSVLAGCASAPATPRPVAPTTTALVAPVSVQAAPAAWGQLPVYFVENAGQFDPRVGYYANPRGGTAYFTGQGVTFGILGRPGSEVAHHWQGAPTTPDDPSPQRRWVVAVDFLGAAPDAKPVGLDRAEATFNYFKGAPEQWTTSVPTYHGVTYPDLWPGIDLQYVGEGDHLKYTFAVQPGADPQQIALAYRGTDQVHLTEDGGLEAATPLGSIREAAPLTYQDVDGQHVEIPSSFVLTHDPEIGAYVVGFEVGTYDPSRPLLIDPALIIYAGFIGGTNVNGFDEALTVAVHPSGEAYVGGTTTSTQATFPEVVGPDLTYNGGADGYVAKVAANGTGLVYAGYIGGSERERVTDLAVDGGGNAYVTGHTASTQFSATPFPISPGAFDRTHNGGDDVFVLKISANANTLVYSTFAGGSGEENGGGIAIEPGCQSGCAAYVVGETQSANMFSTGQAGPDATFNDTSGQADGFVLKLNATGTAAIYGGYVGGANLDRGKDVAVDSTGSAFIVGETDSAQGSFPNGNGIGTGTGKVNAPGFDQSHNGGADAFVVRLNPAGTGYVYVTYLGGGNQDQAVAIAIDGGGHAYVTGETTSGANAAPRFPTLIGPETEPSGGGDAFISRLSPAGTALVYSGLIGGSQAERAGGVAVDSRGTAYVVGATQSSGDQGFPILAAMDTTLDGSEDAFLVKVKPNGTAFEMATFLGGSSSDSLKSIAVDGQGQAFVVGSTTSTQTTGFPVRIGPDLTHNGGSMDVFVARILTTTNLSVTTTDSADPAPLGSNLTYTVVASNNGPLQATDVTLVNALPSGSTFISATPASGACGASIGGVVTCTIGTLNVGASRSVSFVVQPTTPGTLTNRATVSANEGDLAVANNTDTETTAATAPPVPPVPPAPPAPPAPAEGCAARPPVRVQISSAGPGTRQASVTVTAQTSVTVPANGIRQIRFESTANALIDILGQTSRSGAFTIDTPGDPTSIPFSVRFTTPGQASLVRLIVVDACGDWPTFVGAGTAATGQ